MIKQISKYRDIIIILFAIVVFVYVAFSLFKIVTTSAPDFPSYYYATKDLLEHKNPYVDKDIPNIFIYPAATSVFYLPFIIFPFSMAQSIFVILSALTVPLIVYLSLDLLYKKFTWRHVLLFTSFAYLSFPTKFTLGMGQVNLLALLFLILGYYLYSGRKNLLSGIFIGISFLIKPILAFILIFLISNRAWKTLLSISITLLFLVVSSFALYGIENEIYYVTKLVPSLIAGTEGREVYYNQGIMGFISRSTADPSTRKYLSLFLSGILIGVTFFVILKHKLDLNAQFALFLTLLPIVHTLSWQHYFMVLIFPFILTTKKSLEDKKNKLFFLVLLSYFLISWNYKNPDAVSVLLQSHVLYGAILLWGVSLRLFMPFHKRYRNKGK